jgi:hypothetical protein
MVLVFGAGYTSLRRREDTHRSTASAVRSMKSTLRTKKGKEYTMIKLALRYARYALSALATIGFGLTSN